MNALSTSVPPAYCNHRPPKNASSYNFAGEFSFIVYDDYRMNATSLNLQIDENNGRGYQNVLSSGVVQTSPYTNKNYQVRLITAPEMVGTKPKGTSPSGRSKWAYKILYRPDTKWSDWQKINVSTNCQDVNGNTTSDKYLFIVIGGRPYYEPYQTYYYTDNGTIESTCLYFGNAYTGNTYNASLKTWWGKGMQHGLSLNDCVAYLHTTNYTDAGKQAIDNGWISMKLNSTSVWQNMTTTTEYSLGNMTLNTSNTLDLKVAIPNSPNVEGPISIELGFRPIRQAVKGYRNKGRTVKGGGSIEYMIEEQKNHRINLCINVIKDTYNSYLANFGIRL